ncbi:MAG: glycogen/starch synthase [Candidatus Melainabacteria bacterium]|nr:glycogen/starch synthase [Candidatus Melainabacteria bacterium]
MNIVFIAPECFPFAKAGSIADLVSKLSKEIEKFGHNVKVFIPRYGSIDPVISHIERVPVEFKVKANESPIITSVFKGIIPDSLVSVFFIESQNYFSNSKEIYLPQVQHEERFKFFCTAVLDVIAKLKMEVDIFHLFSSCTTYTAKLLRSRNIEYAYLNKTAIVFTICESSDLNKNTLTNTCHGINNSDYITTVSKTYAYELLSDGRLSESLLQKKDLFCGILSGIDENIYNPESDGEIAQAYSKNYFSSGKRKCKEDLLGLVGLHTDMQIPLFGIELTMDEYNNKAEMLFNFLHEIACLNLQIVLFGKVSSKFENELIKAIDKYKNIKAIFNHEPIKKFYAGTDFFINLNKYEPSGTSVLTAMKYGSVPVAYATGGIKDIVIDVELGEEANGIIFKNYSVEDLIDTIGKAIKLYKNKERWTKLVKQTMSFNLAELATAKKYLTCYERIVNHVHANLYQ